MTERRYTRAHGGRGPSGRVQSLHKTLEHPGETSVQGRIVAPTPEEMRRALSNGECPFCGQRYKNIAAHTNRTHGVDRNELKDMALIPRTKSVCTPELSATHSDRMRQIFADGAEWTGRFRAAGLASVTRPRKISVGGKITQLEKLEKAHTPENHAKGAETLKRRHYRRTAQRDEAIVQHVQNGATLAELLEEFKVTPPVIRNACARAGVTTNFRSTRMKRVEPNGQTRGENAIATMDAAQREIQEKRRQAKLARWAELGKTWDASVMLADEWKVDVKQVRAYLRKWGESVPDGRTVSPKRLRVDHAARLARWTELGEDWTKWPILAEEWGMTGQHARQSVITWLKTHGVSVPDGRAVSSKRTCGDGVSCYT